MTDNLRGILAVLMASTAFVLNDAVIKHVSADLPSGEIIVLRGVIATAMLVVCCILLGAMRPLAILTTPPMLVRLFAAAAATTFIVLSLRHLPLATVTTVVQVTPLAVVAGAAIFLGAPVGWRRWLATLTGLIGVLVIVKPGATAFNPYAIVALLSVLFIAARDLITRTLHANVPTLGIALTATTAVTVASLAIMPFETWAWPPTDAILLLTVSATAILCGQFWMIRAMRSGDIAVVSPFRYSIILWAIAAGYLLWREVPDLSSWLGIAIVTAAGLYTFLREQRLAKAARA